LLKFNLASYVCFNKSVQFEERTKALSFLHTNHHIYRMSHFKLLLLNAFL